MTSFADGAHVAALATARPARGLIAITMWDDVPWQAAFIAALRNQCLTWGGQANLPVPWTKDILNNPLFWRIVEAQDPDLIITSPGSWADLEDLTPDQYAAQADALRARLKRDGFNEEVIRKHVTEWLEDPLVDRPLDVGDVTAQLIARAGLLWWGEHVDAELSLARSPAHGLCVDVREFWTKDSVPTAVTLPLCPGSWDERLAICATAGDFSVLGMSQLVNEHNVAIHTTTVAGGYDAVRFAHDPPVAPAEAPYPTQLTEVGLQWARYGGLPKDEVTVVVGDDPWDFALFYALRRLTSHAYWVPTTWSTDDMLLTQVVHGVERLHPDPARKATVVSFSDRKLANKVAAALARVAHDQPHQWPTGDWTDAFDDHQSRVFCINTMRTEQSLAMYGGATTIISTPIPDPRTRNLGRLQWMVDVRVRDWAPIQDPKIGPTLLEGGDYRSNYARAAQGSITYRAPHWYMGGGVPLEGQVVTPRLRLPSLLEQLRSIASDSGHDVRLSDKGTYAEDCARLLGGSDVLHNVLNDYTQFMALWELCFSERPTWIIQDRCFWESGALQPLMESLDVGTVARAVARGLLHRGLVHKCERCSAQRWLEMEDLGGPLRCARCRLPFDVNDPHWFGVNENDPPKWLFRVNEMVWQFLKANGDIPVRALQKEVPEAIKVPVASCFEVEITQSNKPMVELDFCASRNGRLYICEAKLKDKLDPTVAGETARLAKLRQAATILRADAVVLATGAAAWKKATLERSRAEFPGDWPLLIPTSGARPAPDETS
jgi:hypothetical protein